MKLEVEMEELRAVELEASATLYFLQEVAKTHDLAEYKRLRALWERLHAESGRLAKRIHDHLEAQVAARANAVPAEKEE